jgi:hypothetical protein
MAAILNINASVVAFLTKQPYYRGLSRNVVQRIIIVVKHHKPFVKGYNIACCLFLQLVSYITMTEL